MYKVKLISNKALRTYVFDIEIRPQVSIDVFCRSIA